MKSLDKISFLDLKKINEEYNSSLKKSFSDFLNSGWYILGNGVAEFEKSYAQYCGSNFCIGVANGLDALRLIFEGYKSMGRLKDGDEVIVPANTYIASILAISQSGLIPILVEPNETTFNLSRQEAEAEITSKTKAIMTVHLYGQLSDVDGLIELKKDRDLILIEDCAQSHGALRNNIRAGNFGDASGFSFYPGKNLGALGDGGAITTNDVDLNEIIRNLRNYGSSKKYVNEYIGFNSRLDELQAYVLNLKLKNLDRDNEIRRGIAKKYIEGINNPKINLPFYSQLKDHVFHLFVILCDKRDELQAYLQDHQIQTLIHYPIPPHKQKAYSYWNNLSFPLTENIHKRVLSLPISPVMEDEEVQTVINIINEW